MPIYPQIELEDYSSERDIESSKKLLIDQLKSSELFKNFPEVIKFATELFDAFVSTTFREDPADNSRTLVLQILLSGYHAEFKGAQVDIITELLPTYLPETGEIFAKSFAKIFGITINGLSLQDEADADEETVETEVTTEGQSINTLSPAETAIVVETFLDFLKNTRNPEIKLETLKKVLQLDENIIRNITESRRKVPLVTYKKIGRYFILNSLQVREIILMHLKYQEYDRKLEERKRLHAEGKLTDAEFRWAQSSYGTHARETALSNAKNVGSVANQKIFRDFLVENSHLVLQLLNELGIPVDLTKAKGQVAEA